MGCVWDHCVAIFLLALILHQTDGQFPGFGLQNFNTPPASVAPRLTSAVQRVRPECCAILPQQQQECGFGGITKTACEVRGCCYNVDPRNKFWCFRALSEPCTQPPITPRPARTLPATTRPVVVTVATTAKPTMAQCTILQSTRVDCGYDGIPKDLCQSQSCCHDDQVSPGVPHCYFSSANVPRFSNWSQWSKCPAETCDEGNKTRTRFCTYHDGRRSPDIFCKGTTSETEDCTCGSENCKDKLDDGSCKTWTFLCKTNDVVQKNCRKTCKLCQEVKEIPILIKLDSCKDKSSLCSTFPSLCETSEAFRNNMCSETCGVCGDSESPKSTQSADLQVRRKGSCADKFISCRNITQYCKDKGQEDVLREQCPVTCDLCPETITLPDSAFIPLTKEKVVPVVVATTFSPDTSECKDVYESCYQNRDLCVKEAHSITMNQVCRRTCGQCRADPESQTFPSGINPIFSTPVPAATLPNIISAAQNECKDDLETCADFKSQCDIQSNGWQSSCRKTCNLCSTEQMTESTTQLYVAPITVSGSCKDGATFCEEYSSDCSSLSDELKQFCRKTCKLCSVPTFTAAPTVGSDCKDDQSFCSDYASDCSPLSDNLKHICRKSCGLCRDTLVSGQVNTPTPAVVAPAQEAPCRDLTKDCSSFMDLCTTQPITMRAVCRKSCKFCDDPSATVAPPIPESPTASTVSPAASRPCKDDISLCTQYKSGCDSLSVESKKLCRKTCGLCSDGFKSVESQPAIESNSCKDDQHFCSGYKNDCSPLSESLKQMCKKSCGLCRGTSVPVVVPTTPLPAVIATHHAWSKWSQCTDACGPSKKIRVRNCILKSPPQINCVSETESMKCLTEPCPFEGVSQGESCVDKAEPSWCQRMDSTISSFCENELLASNCRKTCGIC